MRPRCLLSSLFELKACGARSHYLQIWLKLTDIIVPVKSQTLLDTSVKFHIPQTMVLSDKLDVPLVGT